MRTQPYDSCWPFESELREISQGIFPTLFNSSSNQMFWGGKRETMRTVIKSSKLVSCIHIAFYSKSVGWWQWNRVKQIVFKCSPIGPSVIFTSAIEFFGSEITVLGCQRGALLLRHVLGIVCPHWLHVNCIWILIFQKLVWARFHIFAHGQAVCWCICLLVEFYSTS